MPDRDDPQLDAMLTDFFRDALEGQRGRSERHFRAYVKAAAQSAWRQKAWLIAAFTSGVAASVAALWASPLLRSANTPRERWVNSGLVQPGTESPPELAIAAGLPIVERVVRSQTTDEGIILLKDDTPVRVVRRRGMEQTRWYDERDDAVRAQQVTPKDDVLLIKLTTY